MSEQIATRDAYGKAIVELGKQNPNVVVLDADLAKATKTTAFAKEFPERHFDIGIAEMNMAGIAAGLSTCGKIPYVSTFAVFGTGRIYDMIRNAICYPKLNVKLALTHAGLTVGEDGASHQCVEDIALMNVLPNMTVFVPADAEETKQAIFAAAKIDGPVYIRMGRAKTDVIYSDTYRFVPGKASILSEGSDITLAACGIMVPRALKAKELLEQQGIHAEVINFSTIKPFDTDTLIRSVQKTGAVVATEEHSMYGGLGSVVSGALSLHCPVPMEQVAVMDTFGESGKPDELLEKYHLTAEEIVRKSRIAINRKK
ncbi:MAG: transketolase family protein [Anaerofustis sp.]